MEIEGVTMGKVQFDEYIKKQSPSTGSETTIDWERKKEEWLEYLRQFNDRSVHDYFPPHVEGWLSACASWGGRGKATLDVGQCSREVIMLKIDVSLLFYRHRINATSAFFSSIVRSKSRTRLKNSTVSSNVNKRPSW